ncbi:Omp28-related outer membrane protein [Psychroserpens algicola]|uniref:Omp28-related outer membrane protein n=1 Tax=Psychroserpens algicola TaxID=1719034 RepID=A0ABT0H899_9FLAO|nr:Omp28-related outer membrane protein [Psychroserpens algicola]MCK8480587.1 Omp28-related outer membrane protein [Psychroserpens algicola]
MKIKNFTKIFLFVAVAALFSCSSSSDGDGDGDGDGGGGVTSISVTASSQFVDFGSTINFTVKTNEGTDVTSSATILVNNESIGGSAFTATETGEYSVKATYETFTSAAINVNVLPIIVSVETRTAQDTYNLGDRIEFEVFGIDNDGGETNVTSASTVFVNGTESFSGSNVIPGDTGTMDAYATFNGFTSEVKTVTVEDNASTPATFDKRALIEDYTGTWCGWCPRVSYGIELVKEASDKVAVVAVHSGDVMQNSYGSTLIGTFNPGGSYPTAILNRDVAWNYPEPNNVNQVTAGALGSTSTGVAIATAIKGNNLSFMVSAGFGQNLSGAKLVVLLLENGLMYDQANYTDYYGGADVLENFVHDHVLRYAFTNPLGDAIPGGELTAGNTYRMKMEYTIPTNVVTNAAKAELVAMVVNSNNELINVNFVKVGEKSDFSN